MEVRHWQRKGKGGKREKKGQGQSFRAVGGGRWWHFVETADIGAVA